MAERLYTYNARSELTNAALGSAPDTYAYDNDADGCKASWTNTKCSPAGRAAEAQPMGRRRVNIGNRKTAQEDAEAITYEANALNQYTDITTGEESFIPEYDGDGKSPDGCKGDWTNREARLPRRGEPPMGRRRINQTRIRTSTGIWTASYNAQNRPVRFTRENADGSRTVITAAYDYLGRRAWKKAETIAIDAAIDGDE